MEYHNRSGCLTPSRSENDPRIRKLKGFSPFTLPKKKERYQRSKGSSPINGLHALDEITYVSVKWDRLYVILAKSLEHS
ncbi:hypothetical protein MTR_5g061720 [Medicago truncatula]|uniref:Uncharacterized protein n=1 Tax=Medicago truncatula TaxID=3880 RepID=G7KA10_MEDTR|nr:hypothetical protein MTR_5g061720 [Medicago truncatula]